MHHANHFYGHAHVLARYAGLAEVPRIWGYLQHGWNTHDGFAVGTHFAPGFSRFVWSSDVARRGWALGLRRYVVIGSPWAYLLRMERPYEHPVEREGTIVYPFHGWEQQLIVGSHDRYVRQLREVEGDVPITICLYWNEFRDKAVRRIYERAGFRVISHGYRGHMWRGTDVHFLDKQLAEVRRHKRVVSNRLGSALLYGASVGAQVGIYGDPMILENERAALGGREKQLRLFPELHQPFVPDDYARQLAADQLGQDCLLSQYELREALGWRDAELAAGAAAPVTDVTSMSESGEDDSEQLDRIPTDDARPGADSDEGEGLRPAL
ncbi:hypothetical protein [Flexivirga sp. B27]